MSIQEKKVYQDILKNIEKLKGKKMSSKNY